MKDFLVKNKTFLAILTGTLAIFIGGIILFTKPNNTSEKRVNDSILIPPGSISTSGFSDGEYLPANPSATVNLVEFGDYQCPACGIYSPMIKQLLGEFSGKITFTFRNYPLPQHANAKVSSYAALSAGKQGKYWEMHDKLFETQSDWSNSGEAKGLFAEYAKDLGLDTELFLKDFDSSEVKQVVENDYADGNTIGISETPTYYLNGQKIKFTGVYEDFKSLIQGASGE